MIKKINLAGLGLFVGIVLLGYGIFLDNRGVYDKNAYDFIKYGLFVIFIFGCFIPLRYLNEPKKLKAYGIIVMLLFIAGIVASAIFAYNFAHSDIGF